jgi:tRNA threonylcarbamoyl adenosine modification protein (Sua5/YciO/YrdC/YwlC family)
VHELEDAVAAIRGGGLAIVPTDTVYGLAATPVSEEPVRGLYRAKGRAGVQPTALVVASLDALRGAVPELTERDARIAAALLPGPYTLVLSNPARRFPWLNGATPETIGVRVPAVDGVAKALLDRVELLAATSANLPGGPDPRRLEEVPEEIRAAAVALDGGALPGTASTVLDLTGPEPRILREGAVPAAEALRAIGPVL